MLDLASPLDGFGSPFGARRGGATPLTIFGSRLMFWYDLSDVYSLYQSTDTSTPVTALNDPIGRVSDKSGKGNHATQGTSAARPLWKQDGNNQYNATFDGTDDCLATAAIDLSAYDKFSLFTAAKKTSNAFVQPICEFSADVTANAGGFANFFNEAAADDASVYLRGNSTGITRTNGLTNSTPYVFSAIMDIGGASLATEIVFRKNGAVAAVSSSSGTAGTGNLGNYPIYIGRRGGVGARLTGSVYQIFGVQGVASASEIAAAEAYLNSKSSAY